MGRLAKIDQSEIGFGIRLALSGYLAIYRIPILGWEESATTAAAEASATGFCSTFSALKKYTVPLKSILRPSSFLLAFNCTSTVTATRRCGRSRGYTGIESSRAP